MPSKSKKQRLKEEIIRNVVLTIDEKEYWLSRIEEMPPKIVDALLKEFVGTNKHTDRYIKKALEDDAGHQYMAHLQAEMRKMKTAVQTTEKKKEEAEADEELEQKLKEMKSIE